MGLSVGQIDLKQQGRVEYKHKIGYTKLVTFNKTSPSCFLFGKIIPADKKDLFTGMIWITDFSVLLWKKL